MNLDRRALVGSLLTVLAGAGPSRGQAANQWFAVQGDDGHPVPNIRLPVELASDVEELPGAIWGGGGPNPAVTLAYFYDFNCPWCRAASGDLSGLMRQNADLRVGLVNNPILSAQSAQAAKVHLAVLSRYGAKVAHDLYDRLIGRPGRLDGPIALETVGAMGLDRREVERDADSAATGKILGQQMRLAANLGLVATPSYVAGGAAVLGYPGPKALGRIVTASRACGAIAC